MKKLEYQAKLISNDVHDDGKIKVVQEKEMTFAMRIKRLLGMESIHKFPVEDEDAADWREGDKLKIKLQNEGRTR
jgi:hypothetical protein